MFKVRSFGAWLPFVVTLPLLASCTTHITNTVATQAVAVQAGQAGAQGSLPNPNAPLVRAAVSGVKQKIDFGYSVNPDCSTAGNPVVKLKSPPAHGTITFEPISDFPNFPKDNPRSACNTGRVPGIGVFYTSTEGYVGRDQANVDLIFPAGGYRSPTYQITVE